MCVIIVGRLTVIRGGFNISIAIRDLPQCREHFRCILKITFGEAFNLCFDIGANLLSRRILHPTECQLFNVQVPDLIISMPLVSEWSAPTMRLTH
jgi:hypothetical protein